MAILEVGLTSRRFQKSSAGWEDWLCKRNVVRGEEGEGNAEGGTRREMRGAGGVGNEGVGEHRNWEGCCGASARRTLTYVRTAPFLVNFFIASSVTSLAESCAQAVGRLLQF